MKDELRLWNLLHDGDIVELRAGSSGTVLLVIEVEFLDDDGEIGSLQVELIDCRELVFVDGDSGEKITDVQSIAGRQPDILSAGPSGDGESIIVVCSEGELLVRYGASTVRRADGSIVTLPELESTSMRYWEDFEREASEST